MHNVIFEKYDKKMILSPCRNNWFYAVNYLLFTQKSLSKANHVNWRYRHEYKAIFRNTILFYSDRRENKTINMKFVVLVCFLVVAPICIMGHGMVMDPVNRASRWRVDPSAPADYNDNQQWCGSLGVCFFIICFCFSYTSTNSTKLF